MAMAVNIGSDQPERLSDYYKKLFNEPLIEQGGYTSWLIDGNMITVGPHDEVTGKNPQPGRVVWSLLSSDVEADYERYVAAGASVVRELYQDADAPQFWIATFADPDDNYFQIVQQKQ